jgi:hypothetical protein
MSERSDPEKALDGDHGLGFEPEHPELSQAAETPAAQTASERPLQAQGHCLSPRDHLLNLPCKENPLNVALKNGGGGNSQQGSIISKSQLPEPQADSGPGGPRVRVRDNTVTT